MPMMVGGHHAGCDSARRVAIPGSADSLIRVSGSAAESDLCVAAGVGRILGPEVVVFAGLMHE